MMEMQQNMHIAQIQAMQNEVKLIKMQCDADKNEMQQQSFNQTNNGTKNKKT